MPTIRESSAVRLQGDAVPKILDAAVKQIKAKGHSTSSAYAIATSALQKAGELRKGHATPTAKGIKRGAMSRAQRHKQPA